MNWRLGLLAIALTLGFNWWAYWGLESVSERLSESKRRHKDTLKMIETLVSLRANTEGKITIVDSDFDFTMDISTALQKAGIQLKGSLNASSSKAMKESKLLFRSIRNPIKEPVTIRQLLVFIKSVCDSEARYNLKSLTLTPAEKRGDGKERWNAEFELLYCQKS